MRATRRTRWAAILAVSSLVLGCGASAPADRNRLRGSRVVVLGPWSGTEQRRFGKVLDLFASETGAAVHYVSAGNRYIPDLIDAAIARGTPPDVALLPQPALLWHYAEAGRLQPLDAGTRRAVTAHYSHIWRSLATWHGRQYGVWFKAANKSLIWYDVATFERAGVVPPEDLQALVPVATKLRRQGIAPFAVAGRDGWTLTDWFENIYLRLAGPARYDALTTHRIPWTDPSVRHSLALMARLLAPRNILRGPSGALRLTFEASVPLAFGPPARAAMLAEGDFVAGFLRSGERIGSDVDVFPVPGGYGGLPVAVGGGDVAVALTRRSASTELLHFLATPEAAQVWAADGGYISPNQDVDLGVYPDAFSRAVARQVIEAGSGFRFDLSDLQPAAFGSAPWSGMQGVLRHFLRDRDVAAAARGLEAGAERVEHR